MVGTKAGALWGGREQGVTEAAGPLSLSCGPEPPVTRCLLTPGGGAQGSVLGDGREPRRFG